MADGRARVFGTVAEEYDRIRPGYDADLVDDVLAYVDVDTMLEVGAGTGKATVAFAGRGLRITAVEPDPAMVAVLARNLSPYPGILILETDFEGYDGAGAPFDLVVSTQAWHWTDPATRWERAARLLRPGGALALAWHHVWLSEPAERDAVIAAYRACGVGFEPQDAIRPDEADSDWPRSEFVEQAAFTDLTERQYRRPRPLSTADYLGWLDTTSLVRILPATERDGLFAALAGAVPHGVRLTDDLDLYLGRRR